MPVFVLHFFTRALWLIVFPLSLYTAFFYIHFRCVPVRLQVHVRTHTRPGRCRPSTRLNLDMTSTVVALHAHAQGLFQDRAR